MELRIVIFLAFTMVTVVTNSLLIWFAYKAFANFASKTTETMMEFERSGLTKAWIDALQTAAQQAVTVTDATKRRIADFEPVLGRVQQNYAMTLGTMDSKLDAAAEEISDGSRRVRDMVAKPAFTVMAFAAGLNRALSDWAAEDD